MMKAREKGEVWGQVEPPNSPPAAGSSSMPSSPSENTQQRFDDGTLVSPASNKRFSLIDTLKNYTFGSPTSNSSYSESTSSLSSDNDAPSLPEDDEDIYDALCPVYDQLSLVKWWWILEFWPIHELKKDKAGEWIKEVA